MILESMVMRLRGRTHQLDRDSQLIDELNSGSDWAWNRIVTNNANILKVDNFQSTMAATTSSYNLGSAVPAATPLIAIKWLGIKFPSDSKFNPVIFIDSSDNRFISADQDTASSQHPVYAAVENLTQIRFAPPLPAGTILRCDFIYSPADLSLSANALVDLPNMLHEAIVDKATAQMFANLDDDRANYWEVQALSKIYSAANNLNRRQYTQQPRIRPFNRRNLRWPR